VRRVLVRRFPYKLIYSVRDDTLRIIAVCTATAQTGLLDRQGLRACLRCLEQQGQKSQGDKL